MRRTTFLWPLLGGAVLFLALFYWRGFAPLHALVVAVAGSALVYWTLRAVDNLKRLR